MLIAAMALSANPVQGQDMLTYARKFISTFGQTPCQTGIPQANVADLTWKYLANEDRLKVIMVEAYMRGALDAQGISEGGTGIAWAECMIGRGTVAEVLSRIEP